MSGVQTSVLFLLILTAHMSDLHCGFATLLSILTWNVLPPPFLFWLSKAHTHSSQGTSHTVLYNNSDPDAGHQVAMHIYPPIPAVYSPQVSPLPESQASHRLTYVI
ncbi:hypothetical protein GDO81_020347 [Engystomops pustulosus]|uniref:Uncharacterized protein n=1 Tax=Engystomops pustulosus TaxID=76066 RepID=A0AAV6ZGV8_ENGPU|nr:hypothetical protein GDO81_020347 [Engystomops pustulosus]